MYTLEMSGPVAFEDRVLRMGATTVELEHPIADAFACGELILVLFRYDAGWRQFSNLQAIASQGTRAWVAELPTSSSGDAYVGISSRDPLVAASWSGFQCTLDPHSGRITGKAFTK